MYDDGNKDEMITRDYLALDRTELANSRTLLAYIRTAIAVFAAGIGMMEFIESRVIAVIGVVFMAVSPFVAVTGIFYYVRMKRKLGKLK